MTQHDITQGLSTFQFALIVWLILLTLIIGGIFLFYISRKYRKEKTRSNPILQAAVIFFVLMMIYLAFAAFGFRTQEEVNSDIKYLLLIGLLLVVWFTYASYRSKKTIPPLRMWNNYVLPAVKQYWNAEPYKGSAYVRAWLFHKTIQLGGKSESEQNMTGFLGEKTEGIELVDVFLGQAKFANVFKFLMVMNKYTGEEITSIPEPTLTLDIVKDLLGKEAVSSLKQPLEEYAKPHEERIVEQQAA